MGHDNEWMAPGLLFDAQDFAITFDLIFVIAFDCNIQSIRIASLALRLGCILVLDTSDVTLASTPRNLSTVSVQIRCDGNRNLIGEENDFRGGWIGHSRMKFFITDV